MKVVFWFVLAALEGAKIVSKSSRCSLWKEMNNTLTKQLRSQSCFFFHLTPTYSTRV